MEADAGGDQDRKSETYSRQVSGARRLQRAPAWVAPRRRTPSASLGEIGISMPAPSWAPRRVCRRDQYGARLWSYFQGRFRHPQNCGNARIY